MGMHASMRPVPCPWGPPPSQHAQSGARCAHRVSTPFAVTPQPPASAPPAHVVSHGSPSTASLRGLSSELVVALPPLAAVLHDVLDPRLCAGMVGQHPSVSGAQNAAAAAAAAAACACCCCCWVTAAAAASRSSMGLIGVGVRWPPLNMVGLAWPPELRRCMQLSLSGLLLSIMLIPVHCCALLMWGGDPDARSRHPGCARSAVAVVAACGHARKALGLGSLRKLLNRVTWMAGAKEWRGACCWRTAGG